MNASDKSKPRERRDRDDDPSDAHAVGAAPRDGMSDDELTHFQATYRDALYYSTGRDWGDYAPAYRYGRTAFERHQRREARFEQVEDALAREWDRAKAPSRLAWAEARGAVLDAWQRAESQLSHRDPRTSPPRH